MNSEMLTSRQQAILNRVIEIHIETAEPVGSKAITRLYTRLYNDSYSPATVRHEMGVLEERGYLTHPHTSAGRVPTDTGYRYYVNHGLAEEDLPGEVFNALTSELFKNLHEGGSWIEEVSAVLSLFAEAVGVVVVSETRHLRLFLQGLSRMLEKPEFQDVHKIRGLLKTLDEKMELADWLARETSPAGVSIKIGCENRSVALQDCAVVAAHYGAGGERLGTVAVLGPKRMRYARAVPLVGRMARFMDQAIAQRGLDWS